MAQFEFRLPDLGEGIHEAQVLAWKVGPGQVVEAFDALCEVESAKAAVELTTPVAGQVLETRVEEGGLAHTGEVLVVIATPGGEIGAETPLSEATAAIAQSDAATAADAPEAEWFGIVGQAPPRAPMPTPTPAPSPTAAVRAAPLVRRLARERGLRLEDIAGSGPQGRVRLSDLEAAPPHRPDAAPQKGSEAAPQERPGAAPRQGTEAALPQQPGAARPDRVEDVPSSDMIPLAGLRKRIADHMLEAWRNAPQVTAMDLVDVTELVRARDVLRTSPDAARTRLTYLPFFVKAAIAALKTVPSANARVHPEQQTIELLREFHIGIATAVPGGLVVPVLRHADRLSVLELAVEIERLVGLARERKISRGDLTGSTFTITSFGGMPGGPLFATPILNYPDVAILGLGRIDLQPRVVDGLVVPRHCIGVSFTFDHRVMDGEDAGRFMAAFRRPIEQPLELLLQLR